MEPKAAFEIINAIESAQKNYPIPESSNIKPAKWRSLKRQWDKIICKICSSCGKRLGRYENANNLAFCYECREILFPESIQPKDSFRKRFSQRKV